MIAETEKGDQNGHPLGILTDYLPTELIGKFIIYFKQLMVEAAGVDPASPLMDKGFQTFPGKNWEKQKLACEPIAVR